jgi:hypothetical protein
MNLRHSLVESSSQLPYYLGKELNGRIGWVRQEPFVGVDDECCDDHQEQTSLKTDNEHPRQGVGWNPASNSEGGRKSSPDRIRGGDASELRLGLMSSIWWKGCIPAVSGRKCQGRLSSHQY